MIHPFLLLGHFVLAPSRVSTVFVPDLLTLGLGFDHVTCYGQYDITWCDVSRGISLFVWSDWPLVLLQPTIHQEKGVPQVAVGPRIESPSSRCHPGP